MHYKRELKLTPAQLRKLQLVELDILLELDRICREYDIHYFLCGGSLLGAVRHKGFIPWDDDADVGFLRSDYERFCQVFSQKADGAKYFLQTWKTDPHYRWSYGKIRRLGTEYIRTGQEHMKYVTGISIDIFPYDELPVDEELHKQVEQYVTFQNVDEFTLIELADKALLRQRKMRAVSRQAFLCGVCRKLLYSVVGKYQEPKWSMRILFAFCSLIPRNWVIQLMEKTAQKYNGDHKYGGVRIRQFSYSDDIIIPKLGLITEKLKERRELLFEGFMFYTIKDTHWYLIRTFCPRYMELPPEDMRHGVAPVSEIDFGNVFNEMPWCTEDFFKGTPEGEQAGDFYGKTQ